MKMIGMATLFAMLAGVFGGNARPTHDYAKRRPVGSKLRNPADPVQAASIEAAEGKRRNRAQRLIECASNSVAFNKAHVVKVQEFHDERTYTVPNRLNPFYVNK